MKYLIIILCFMFFLYHHTMGVEERHFDLVKKEGNIEIRNYSQVMAAEVLTSGSRNEAASAAFRILVKFIGGDNSTGTKIAMTTPVSQIRQDKETWIVSFYMPEKMKKDTMPVPKDDRIIIKELQNVQLAAIRFSGGGDANNLNKHEKKLRQYLNENNYTYEDKPSYAFYNPPFIPWFMRRNEVLFELKN